MIGTILFIIVGAGLLVLLYFFAVRTGAKVEGGAQALLEARQAVTSLRTGLLPLDLVDRVFAQNDLDFVMSKSGKSVQELFRRERRKIALAWAAQLKSQVLSLKEFHSGQSRLYADLDLRTELALALNFTSLLVLCRILQITFYLRGPYGARRVIGPAISAADRVCAVSEKSLAFLSPADRGIRGSAGRQATT